MKKIKYESSLGLVCCGGCGIYFNYDIAKDLQYDYNKIRQEVRCPVCKDIYMKESK